MVTWQMFIAAFSPAALFLCMFLIVAVWPKLSPYLKLYFVLPFNSRGKAISPSEPLTDAERERLPREQREALDAGIRRLKPLGFSLATLSRANADSGWGVGAVLLDERDCLSAHVQVTRLELPDLPPVGSESVAFCTEFTDDTAILTTNFGLNVARPGALCDSVRWPGMRDVEVLYRLHSGRVARDRGGRQPKLPPRDAVFAHVLHHEQRALWTQVEAGYYRFDPDDGVFRMTLKGGFLLHWKLLRPWKPILLARDEQKLRRVLRELGMGTPEEYPPDPKDEVKPALAYHSALVQLPQCGDAAAHAGS
jgi:hypothetical protein